MAKKPCIHGWVGNCSSDRLTVHHGAPKPTTVCGYHEGRFGVGSASEAKAKAWGDYLGVGK